MRRGKRDRGLTLIEIMISLVVMLVGIMAMFSALGTSIRGTSFASRFSQAQDRAVAIIEATRNAPASTLTCLNNTTADNWANCEADCRSNQTGAGATLAQSCIFTAASFSNVAGPLVSTYSDQRVDRSGQQYALVYSNANPTAYRTSFVRQNGPGNRVFDVQVTIGWNDDGTATNPNHFVTMRSGVFN
jgi:prepilin-type N-terminal cleavage/methylation domain-containing protein